jgi:cation:H+ antiporter
VAGAELTVESSIGLARAFGVSEAIIGLTLVALGTSLPELATAVIATLRGHADLAVGNVVGSNIFNLLFILGTTATIHPVPMPAGGGLDLLVLAVLSLALIPITLSRHRVARTEGALLLTAYVVFMVGRVALG